jgi:mannose/cellobiose epimerase-like protein (N-acyl-D-glucosamine 2-epimerase family)
MKDVPYADVRDWLVKEAWPFWAANGIDRVNGGYVEQLALDGTNPNVDFKRTRVIGRQIYVFSHAALTGFAPGLDLARHGYEFLTRNAWLGPDAGWARQLDREGNVKDPTPDLYDLAFIMYAFGWYYRASGDPEAHRWALKTLDFIETHMRHANGVGFLHEKPASGPRQQNPHMHLLEAALINLEATGDARFRRIADEVVSLFRNHFFHEPSRTLAEFFDESLGQLDGEKGLLTEPGHQFEWAWILSGYQRAGGVDMRHYITALVESAERNGVDPETGATFNVVRRDGVVLDRGIRVWPNAERIQAAVAMFETEGRDPRPVFAQSAGVLLEKFLTGTPRGTWREQFDADGTFKADKIPTSTLYHLTIAFLEMLRVEEAVTRRFPAETRRSA